MTVEVFVVTKLLWIYGIEDLNVDLVKASFINKYCRKGFKTCLG